MRTRVVCLLSLLALPAVAAAQGGAPPIYVAPVVPPTFRLLADPAVQKDVGLTDGQKAAAEQVRQLWPLATSGLPMGVCGYVPAELLRAGVNRRTADFLATGLTKDQRTRLSQILFQLREREFGPHQAFAMAARDLGLRPDQVDDVHGLKALRVEEIDRVVTSGKRFEKVKTEVQAANGDTFEKMAEMLTRAQRERLKELRGRPFVGSTFLGERRSLEEAKPAEESADIAAGKLKGPVDPAPAAPFPVPKPGLYDLELKYLDNYEVGKELKLTDGQSGSIARAWREFPAEKPGGKVEAGKETEAHDYAAKVLAEVLTPAQRTRFNEIMMQRRAKVSPEAACTYPPTVSALKLTPIQLQQLAAGKHLADVLSKDQLAKYQQLLGAPFKLPFVWDDYLPGMVSAPPPPVQPVLSKPYAQARDFLRLTDRLKLTDEQVRKLRELAEDEPKVRELIQNELSLEETAPVAGAARSQTAVTAVTEHYRAAVEQQCWDVLDPPQQSVARRIFGRGRK